MIFIGICLDIYCQDMWFFLEINVREDKHIQNQLSIFSIFILLSFLPEIFPMISWTHNLCICIQIHKNLNFQITRWTKRSDFSLVSLALNLIRFTYYTCVSMLSLWLIYLCDVLQFYLLLPVSTASVLVQKSY